MFAALRCVHRDLRWADAAQACDTGAVVGGWQPLQRVLLPPQQLTGDTGAEQCRARRLHPSSRKGEMAKMQRKWYGEVSAQRTASRGSSRGGGGGGGGGTWAFPAWPGMRGHWVKWSGLKRKKRCYFYTWHLTKPQTRLHQDAEAAKGLCKIRKWQDRSMKRKHHHGVSVRCSRDRILG